VPGTKVPGNSEIPAATGTPGTGAGDDGTTAQPDSTTVISIHFTTLRMAAPA
jgi:hypothetical protein